MKVMTVATADVGELMERLFGGVVAQLSPLVKVVLESAGSEVVRVYILSMIM